MAKSLKYRQQVGDFVDRLDTLLPGGGPKTGRALIDTTGSRTIRMPFTSDRERLERYGEARNYTAARLLALSEVLRDTGNLDRRARAVRVETTGAKWQAFRGTETLNACHTSPAHLQFDGHLPTMITRLRALQRHIINEFADCMLLPRAINELDGVMDDGIGRIALVSATEMVINEKGASWKEGYELFRESLNDFRPTAESLIQLRGSVSQATDPNHQEKIDTYGYYFNGLFYLQADPKKVEVFQAQIVKEAERS